MTDTDEAGVRQLVSELEVAWNSGDADRWGRQFTDDAHFLVFDGVPVVGADAIAKEHAFAFDGPRKGTTATFTVERIAFLADDVAVVHARVRITGIPQGFGPPVLTSVPTFSAVRRQDGWRIADFVNLVYNPVPPAHHPDHVPADLPAPAGPPPAAPAQAH